MDDKKINTPTIYLAGTHSKEWRGEVCNSFQIEDKAKDNNNLLWSSDFSVLDRFNGVGLKRFHEDFNNDFDEVSDSYGICNSVRQAKEKSDLIFIYISTPPDPLTFLEAGVILGQDRIPIEGFDTERSHARVVVYMDESAQKRIPKDPVYRYLSGLTAYSPPVTMKDALRNWIYKFNYDLLLHPDSPIEKVFFEYWLEEMWADLDSGTHLEPNYPVYNAVAGKNFYIDFAQPESQVAVELDGMGHFGQSVPQDPEHENGDPASYRKYLDEDKIQKHYQRHRLLQEDGWELVRFTGREVNNNTVACCEFVQKVIRSRMGVVKTPDPGLLQTGKELKRLRVDAGLTQKQASEVTGLQRRRFSDFERGLLYLPSDSEALLRKKYHELIQPKLDQILEEVPLTYSDEDRLVEQEPTGTG